MAYTSIYNIMSSKDDYEGLLAALSSYTSEYFDTIEQLEDETVGSITYHVISCKIGTAEIRFLTTSNTQSSGVNKLRLYDGETLVKEQGLGTYSSSNGTFRAMFITQNATVLSTFNGTALSSCYTLWLLKDTNDKSQIVFFSTANQDTTSTICSIHEDGGSTTYDFYFDSNTGGEIVATPMVMLQGVCKNAYFVNVRPFYTVTGPFELTVDGDVYFTMGHNAVLLKS